MSTTHTGDRDRPHPTQLLISHPSSQSVCTAAEWGWLAGPKDMGVAYYTAAENSLTPLKVGRFSALTDYWGGREGLL